MRTEIIMPQMGESIAEGTVVSWLKKPGDAVERDEDLFEISTDKVESVIPSPVSGFLAEIVVGPGQKVEVGTVVGYISNSSQDVASGSASAPAPSAAAPAAAAAATPTPAAAPAAPAATADASADELRRTRSTPLVRRIAAEHNVDIAAINGSGVAGRVTKKDIMAFLADGGAARKPAAAPSATPVGMAPSVTLHAPEVPVGPGDRVEPMSVMRSNIADHMVMSRHVSAHCQTVHECDVTHVERLRQKHKARYAERGLKLSFTTFLVKAVADALRTFPLMNASVSGKNIVYHGEVNVGVAVAMKEGLIVPVVKRADELSIAGLSRSVADLSDRARSKKLEPGDVQGGTFTISNAGVFGSLFGVPIISQPQVGILGVGGVSRRVVVIDEDDNFAVRSMVYFCLTFDHRLIDGSVADGFVNKIKEVLQNFPEDAL